MKNLVQAIILLSCPLAMASDVRDYCLNVDGDVSTFEGDLSATYMLNGKEEDFDFNEEDYSVKEEKRVVFEESKIKGLKDTHYALSLTVAFNKKIKVPESTGFSDVFNAAKNGTQVKIHFICRDYAAGSPVPPPPPPTE